MAQTRCGARYGVGLCNLPKSSAADSCIGWLWRAPKRFVSQPMATSSVSVFDVSDFGCTQDLAWMVTRSD